MNWNSFQNTTLQKGFLCDKQLLNRKVTMQAVWDRFSETGRIDAFRFDWEEGKSNKPHIFWDSDVAKWMEAAAYILSKEEDSDLRTKIEWLIDRIEENQDANGYFNIYFTVIEPEKRFTNSGAHELYCCGHLLEAACAYYEGCGDTRFLELMKKYVDHVYKVFVVEKSAAFMTPGHEEIELALLRLYRITGEKKHLDLCLYFLNTRGSEEDLKTNTANPSCYPVAAQWHKPVREQKEALGHVVRALYLYTAMAEAAGKTGDAGLQEACDALFEDIVNSKMHITGGLGQSHAAEAFSIPYDLKNDTAYTETCGSIAMILFCERMFANDHASRYADVIERELYNGMMSGLSVSGDEFFYTNPLEINLQDHNRHSVGTPEPPEWLPITQRVKVFGCSCCPPNVNRTLASLERLLYYVEDGTVYINQFAESVYDDGKIRVEVSTDYPNTGLIKVKTSGAKRVCVRIPDWCNQFTVSCEYGMEDGYAVVTDSEFSVEFAMEPALIMAHENVWNDANKIAVMRGPVVYCAEAVDQTAELHKLYIDTSAEVKVESSAYFGLPVLSVAGFIRKTPNALYSPLQDCFAPTVMKLVPYYGFANRGETDMRIWLHYK